MPAPEKQNILEFLEKGRDALSKALAGVDEQLVKCRSRPGVWSILECIEHLVLSERFLLRKLAAASRSVRCDENLPREARIWDRGLDRSHRAESPEPGRPCGGFKSLSEAVAAFDSVRAETVAFVEGFSDDLRSWVTDHPLIPGPVNCREMLLILAVHPARHAKQIDEIKSQLAAQVPGERT